MIVASGVLYSTPFSQMRFNKKQTKNIKHACTRFIVQPGCWLGLGLQRLTLNVHNGVHAVRKTKVVETLGANCPHLYLHLHGFEVAYSYKHILSQ